MDGDGVNEDHNILHTNGTLLKNCIFGTHLQQTGSILWGSC